MGILVPGDSLGGCSPYVRFLDTAMRMRKYVPSSLLCIAVGVCALSTPKTCVAGGPAHVTVLCGERNMYESAAAALIKSLQRNGHTCQLVEWPKAADKSARRRVLKQIAASNPNIVVASGTSATSHVLGEIKDTPVVYFMVPNALDAPFMAPGHRDQNRVAGVAANVSASDQVRWIKQLDRNAKRLGVLYSHRTKNTMQSLRDAARPHGIEIVAIETSSDLIPNAIETLTHERVDGLLMIPDATIYNSASVQRILLWGARQKKPVWSFSEGIVKAGAFAGQFANDEAVGRQTADLVQKILDGTQPQELGLQFPDRIESAVNTHTSGIIGLHLNDSILPSDVIRIGDQK
jgi:putative ABC transport system substrate-binding protein